MLNLYDHTIGTLDGKRLALRDFAGQAVLLVNTASRCGFTGQYVQLQELHNRFRKKGLVVIGIPSNDFGGQEPGTADDIKLFCQKNYGVDFVMAEKTKIKGKDAHPLFTWLRHYHGKLAGPHWNFYKFLFDKKGNPVSWHSSLTSPLSASLLRKIESTLK